MTSQIRPELKLVGEDGNAFAILGRAIKVLRKDDFPAEFIQRFVDEATSGDYDHLLRTVMEWFDVDGEDR